MSEGYSDTARWLEEEYTSCLVFISLYVVFVLWQHTRVSICDYQHHEAKNLERQLMFCNATCCLVM